MENIPYAADCLREVTALYNEATEFVPNCWGVGEGEFALAVAGAVGEESDGGPEQVEDEKISIVAEGEKVLGFVHYGGHRKGGENDPIGAICFLYYRRGRRDAGQALVDEAEGWFAERGFSRAVAFRQRHRYRFYGFANTYLSDRLDHVSALLQFNGYAKSGGEVFLNGMDYGETKLPAVELDFDVGLEWPQKRGQRPGCHVKAMQGEKLLGECVVDSGGDFSSSRQAQDYGFVNWLGVDEAYRGSGLGKWLLFHARNQMLGQGYGHTAISTAVDNYRAFLFYSNHGYRVVDWTYELSKSLKQS